MTEANPALATIVLNARATATLDAFLAACDSGQNAQFDDFLVERGDQLRRRSAEQTLTEIAHERRELAADRAMAARMPVAGAWIAEIDKNLAALSERQRIVQSALLREEAR